MVEVFLEIFKVVSEVLVDNLLSDHTVVDFERLVGCFQVGTVVCHSHFGLVVFFKIDLSIYRFLVDTGDLNFTFFIDHFEDVFLVYS